MRRRLSLKSETLAPLDANELTQVAGGTLDMVLKSGDICYRNTYVCATDTCLTDVDCYRITEYCTLGRVC